MAQHPWQTKPDRDADKISRIIGPVGDAEPSRDLKIVWVWGVDKNHNRGAHEYGWVMDRFVNTLFPQVPRVAAESVMYFPTDEQWEKADLIVFYCQQRKPWGTREYAMMDQYQKHGGGLMFIHLAILEGTGDELSQRIGLAYGTRDAGHGTTKWGVLPTPVQVTKAGKASEILAGFPERFDLVDEHYWNLNGNTDSVTTMMTAPGGPESASTGPPQANELDGKAWPVIWTKEKDRGRVFGTVLGHNYFAFNDPYFRIIMLRAMAWTMREPFDPFKPLVTLHLER